jgi:hypothetical protein
MTQMIIVVRRPDDHHKGPKEIVRIPYGKGVPKGILIGKGSIITIETKGGKSNGV